MVVLGLAVAARVPCIVSFNARGFWTGVAIWY